MICIPTRSLVLDIFVRASFLSRDVFSGGFGFIRLVSVHSRSWDDQLCICPTTVRLFFHFNGCPVLRMSDACVFIERVLPSTATCHLPAFSTDLDHHSQFLTVFPPVIALVL